MCCPAGRPDFCPPCAHGPDSSEQAFDVCSTLFAFVTLMSPKSLVPRWVAGAIWHQHSGRPPLRGTAASDSIHLRGASLGCMPAHIFGHTYDCIAQLNIVLYSSCSAHAHCILYSIAVSLVWLKSGRFLHLHSQLSTANFNCLRLRQRLKVVCCHGLQQQALTACWPCR